MKTITVGWVAVALVVAAGCGTSTPPGTQQTPPTEPTPQAAAPAITPIAPVTPVDVEPLIALLPSPSGGWLRGKPKGRPLTAGVAYSAAEAVYEKGEATIHLEIIDTGFNQVLLAPLAFMLDAGFSERSADNYKKAAKLGGSPGFETWDNDGRVAEVTVVVAGRFIVTARGRNVDNANAARALVQAVDHAKLAVLK